MENTDVFLGLDDFLERMRQPSAVDLVKSINSFIVSFSKNAPDPERDSAMVQEFLANMEAAFKAHPLWSGCSEEELESVGEGLENFVMTELFTRVFAPLPDDVKADEQLSKKMSLIQQFIRPENLDIKPTYQNETSWLVAHSQKKVQEINIYKAPRDKLVCILNCCKVINNPLLSISSDDDPPGAYDFLPVLIYITIKANPPQLHSNLSYMQQYRGQSRLVSEAAYHFTNMLSAESFISNINARSISMEDTEFEKNMESARALFSNQGDKTAGSSFKTDLRKFNPHALNMRKDNDAESSMAKVPSLSDIENKGATMLLKENIESRVFREYPYMFSQVGDLTISDLTIGDLTIGELLNGYKQLVFKYVCLAKGLGVPTTLKSLNSQTRLDGDIETVGEHQNTGSASRSTHKSQERTAKSAKTSSYNISC